MNNNIKKTDVWKLFIRCAKTGKTYLPLDTLGEYSGRGDAVFSELGMLGLLRRKEFEGYKTRMPARLFMNQKFGRMLWLSRKDDFTVECPAVREARSSYCLTPEGARELLRLHGLRHGDADNSESAIGGVAP